MANKLWYKKNGNWSVANLYLNKDGYSSSRIWYKKNRWLSLEYIESTKDFIFDNVSLVKCKTKEAYSELVDNTFGHNIVQNNILDLTDTYDYFYTSSTGLSCMSCFSKIAGGVTFPSFSVDSNYLYNLLPLYFDALESYPIYKVKRVKRPKKIEIQISTSNTDPESSGLLYLVFTGNKSNEKYYPFIWADLTSTLQSPWYPNISRYFINNWKTVYNIGKNSISLSLSLDDNQGLVNCFTNPEDTWYYFSLYCVTTAGPGCDMNYNRNGYKVPIYLNKFSILY